MSPRRVLVGLMIVGLVGVVVGVLAFGDKPVLTVKPIPAAKFVPDFDPRAATPEEIRAQARRVFDELRSTIRSMPTGSQEQIKAKNEAFARLPRLAGRLGDMELALQVASEIPDPVLREGAPVRIAQGFRSSRNPEAIEQLVATTENKNHVAEILYFLAWARSQEGDYAAAHAIATDPRLAYPSETPGDAMRPFMALNSIVSHAQIAGDFDAALEAARAAEDYQREMQRTSDDPYWSNQAIGSLIGNYLRAGDPDAALRLIDSLPDGDDSPLADLHSVALAFARRGDLQAAATIRSRLDLDGASYVAWRFTEPARHLAREEKPELSRTLLRQGVEKLEENPVQLIEIAETQHELGFVDDSEATVNAAIEKSDSPFVLIRAAQFMRAIDNPQAARTLLQLAADNNLPSWDAATRSEIAQGISREYRLLDHLAAARLHLVSALQHATEVSATRDRVEEFCQIAVEYTALGDSKSSAIALDLAITAVESIQESDSRAWHYRRVTMAALRAGMNDRVFELIKRTRQADLRTALGLIEELCDELARQGRVSAALALANQVQSPTERAHIFQETIEMILAIAEGRERDEYLQTP